MEEQLFASFLLDRKQGLEIAIAAENVMEATTLTEQIQPLPASVPFLEGITHLRNEVIPVLNLKKRLGLKESDYDEEAKIAVVILANQRFGLLFDDIKEVLRVDESHLLPIQPALQSEDYVISNLITLGAEHRTLEVLDLERLFQETDLSNTHGITATAQAQNSLNYTYSRYVIFTSGGQEYGMPVEISREITFLTDIDDTFSCGYLQGALQLRGNTIPVMNARCLLTKTTNPERDDFDELNRILVMSIDALTFGIIIDDILEILTVTNEKILSMPQEEQSVTGIYEPSPGRNIMLLDVRNLISSQRELLESMARLKTGGEEEEKKIVVDARHLITENCYLIFSISKHFAIELKDVQEILEQDELLAIPTATDFDSDVINLRGEIIPVVNLRNFYGYPVKAEKENGSRLIICRNKKRTIALQVDTIITIYKQEQFHPTPSLNPQLQPRKDTLNHLIEFIDEGGVKEHVLVVNTHNLIRNHLQRNIQTAEPIIDKNENKDTIKSLTNFPNGGK